MNHRLAVPGVIAAMVVPAFIYYPWRTLINLGVLALAFAGLIVVHELGHLVAGVATGNQLLGVTIGRGRQLLRIRRGDFLATLRLNVLGGGSVLLHTDRPRFYRSRRAVVLLAGVGAEIVVLYATYRIFGDTPFTRFVLLAVAFGAVSDLNPSEQSGIDTDGRQLVLLFSMSDAEVSAVTALDLGMWRDSCEGLEHEEVEMSSGVAAQPIGDDPQPSNDSA